MHSNLRRSAFTLIELLVVVAVLAILIGILLPSLGRARASGQFIACAANMRAIAQGMATYNAQNDQFFAPSYVYGAKNEGGSWRFEDQQESPPSGTIANGYVHWSWSLFEGESGVAEKAFQCPTMLNGGAPATNPGTNPAHWEPWQVNDLGQSAGARDPTDRQAKRMAYTGNAAIFPRNKFNPSTVRKNVLVRSVRVKNAARTILAGEFLDNNNYTGIAEIGGGGSGEASQGRSKSHRPVTPFVGGSAGQDVYTETVRPGFPSFFYPSIRAILTKDQIRGSTSLIDGNSDTALNALGRHHPGGNAVYGGTSNFVFADGHVTNYIITDTIRQRLWGDEFYSITGGGAVNRLNPDGSRPEEDEITGG